MAGQGWIRKDTGRAHGSRRKKVGRWGGVEGKTRQGDKTSKSVRWKTQPPNRGQSHFMVKDD